MYVFFFELLTAHCLLIKIYMLLDIVWKSFLASLAGGLLSLDRTAAFQVMASRPIVAAPVIGYILGDAMTGLIVGGILELLFIGGLPVGGHIPPHEIMLAVIITAVSIIGQNMLNGIGFNMLGMYDVNMLFVIGFVILAVIPTDAICKKTDAAARIFNVRFFNAALSDLDKGSIKDVVINNLKGLGVFFVLNFLTIFILTFTGALLIYALLPVLPAAVTMSLPCAFAIVFLLGLSS
ncbi:MAG: PTS sugar transporter subunit IIC, partial [Deltaproteobacteria bacterium]|nr:PTS sugar transporter subunit IIC [Deltaproteobacteria bacterium]